MKLSRDFSFKEKCFLGILGLAILALIYFRVVDNPVRMGLMRASSDKDYYEMEMLTMDIRVAELDKMEAAIQNLKANELSDNGHIWSYMPSYNASRSELDFLNDTLRDTEDYLISFKDLSRAKYQIRRGFTLQYMAGSYQKAVDILKALENSEIRCIVSDFSIAPAGNEDLADGAVRVSCVATFYETMWDGVADSELPKDSARNNEAAAE